MKFLEQFFRIYEPSNFGAFPKNIKARSNLRLGSTLFTVHSIKILKIIYNISFD
jgi:hypothetical protein